MEIHIQNINLNSFITNNKSLLLLIIFLVQQITITNSIKLDTSIHGLNIGLSDSTSFSFSSSASSLGLGITEKEGVISTIQIKSKSKTKLHLKLNTIISYYKEYSSIKINEDHLNKIKYKSKANSSDNKPNSFDIIFAYYDVSKNELDFTDEELPPASSTSKKIVAKGVYQRTRYQTGWDKLNIKTFTGANPLIQCWSAGFMEGVMTSEEIWFYFKNLGVFFRGEEQAMEDIKNFYKKVDEKLKRIITTDAFEKLKETPEENETLHWSYITCLHAQLDGLLLGYNTIADEDKKLTLWDFYLINSEGNFHDLKAFMKINNMDISPNSKFNTSENLKRVYETDNIEKIWKRLVRSGHCSAIVKLVDLFDGTYDMISGHNTWSEYCEMMRSLKIMDWAFEGKDVVIGMQPRKINFSSYPGVLFSGDDFYELDSKVVILQTTLTTLDKFLYKNAIDVDHYIPEFMRIMITNFISNSALDWVENYKSYKNHLYITQWTVLDYNVLEKINSDRSKKDFLSSNTNDKYKGLIYLLEEVPSSIIYKDITGLLLGNTYFGSFNLAYFKEHQKILGLNDFKNTDFTSREHNPRYYILKQLNEGVKNLEDFSHLIRYNGFKKNNSDFPEDPSNDSPDSGISARNDLIGYGSFNGGIDFKIVNKKLVDEMTIYAYGGPTFDDNVNLPPFDFAKVVKTSKENYHNGIPQLWNFTPFLFSQKDFQ